MKNVLFFLAAAFLCSTCSTEIDMLDDWKETTIVYALLDQSQPKQYIRIQKAYLGPDNALTMAQEYDSINYVHSLSVWIQELEVSGEDTTLLYAWQLQPDTLMNKEPGIFNSPMQVIYSMNTPADPAFDTTHLFRLIVDNSQTGNRCQSITNLVKGFNILKPIGPSLDIRKITSATKVTVEWGNPRNSMFYQVGMLFHYRETDVNNNVVSRTAPMWTIGTVLPTSGTSLSYDLKFEPNDFYRYLVNNIPNDPNVVSRDADHVDFVVYAANEELQTYMEVNTPSSSVVQDRPFYTNIQNGYGIFAARYAKTKTGLILTGPTLDTLSYGSISCGLKFNDRNGSNAQGCQ
jgi:hypothetical protein